MPESTKNPSQYWESLLFAGIGRVLLERDNDLRVEDILTSSEQKANYMGQKTLLEKILKIIPDNASEETYEVALNNLLNVYAELFPDEAEKLRKLGASFDTKTKRRVWEEIFRPMYLEFKAKTAQQGAELLEKVLKEELTDSELELVDYVNNWLFFLTKVFGVATRLENIEKAIELVGYGTIFYYRGIKAFESGNYHSLKKDFELLTHKILESGYKPQMADDYLIFEFMEFMED